MRLKTIEQEAADSIPKVKEDMDFSFDAIHEDPIIKEEPFEEYSATFDTPEHKALLNIINFNEETVKSEEINDDIKMHDGTVDVKHEDDKFEDINARQIQIESASGIK